MKCTKCDDRPATRRGMCNRCYMNWWTRRQAYGTFQSLYVDAEPARLHIKNLQAAGLGLRRIADLAGVNRKTLQWITTGRSERGQGPSQQVTEANAQRILAVLVPDVTHHAAASHQVVDAAGTVRRLQALVAFGYPRAHLAARLRITPSNATRLFTTDTPHVLARTARAVEKLFGELEVTPGPSSRARNEGRRRGWPLPMDWDEDTIDDPNAVAPRSESIRSLSAERSEDIAERREQVARWTRFGLSAAEIAERLGISQRHVVRDRSAAQEQVAS